MLLILRQLLYKRVRLSSIFLLNPHQYLSAISKQLGDHLLAFNTPDGCSRDKSETTSGNCHFTVDSDNFTTKNRLNGVQLAQRVGKVCLYIQAWFQIILFLKKKSQKKIIKGRSSVKKKGEKNALGLGRARTDGFFTSPCWGCVFTIHIYWQVSRPDVVCFQCSPRKYIFVFLASLTVQNINITI